ncbi:MAG: DUF3267 domain-containing protein [Oscillospiraceae bacterium]|nr:DUF3267 domain-containing protein [Oscillospiraceae bacterium]
MNGLGTNFERELPASYCEEFVVDANDKKTSFLFSVGSLAITVVLWALAVIMIHPGGLDEMDMFIKRIPLFFIPLLIYIVLHELTHGAAYKLLTGEKLTFGITLSVAFCGVPNIYVYRKASLISLLAPFAVFNIVFGTAVFMAPNAWDKLIAALLLGTHIGGCIGDLYITFLYLFRFRDPRTLMRDTGPKQTFYVPEN